MTKTFEATGKTVEEALDAVCALAGVGLDEGEVEVLDYASKGFLGIGSKEARVRFVVSKKNLPLHQQSKETIPVSEQKDNKIVNEGITKLAVEQDEALPEEMEEDRANSRIAAFISEEAIENIKKDALAFLEPVFKEMKVAPTILFDFKEDVLWISFSGKGLNVLIGRRGVTLNALQYLVNLACNRKKDTYIRIVLDVENYRQGREKTLITLAQKMAEKAVRTERRVELEPMNPHERRVVHIALQNDKRVETLSRGEEPYRRIVIVKKNPRNKNQH